MSLFTTFIFTWHALSDACPKCRALNGKEWRESGMYRGVVWDSIWGDVWDVKGGHSLAHPNCRCQLEVRIDKALPEETDALMQLLIEIKQQFQQILGQVRR